MHGIESPMAGSIFTIGMQVTNEVLWVQHLLWNQKKTRFNYLMLSLLLLLLLLLLASASRSRTNLTWYCGLRQTFCHWSSLFTLKVVKRDPKMKIFPILMRFYEKSITTMVHILLDLSLRDCQIPPNTSINKANAKIQLHQHFTSSFFTQNSYVQLFWSYSLSLYSFIKMKWRKKEGARKMLAKSTTGAKESHLLHSLHRMHLDEEVSYKSG